MAQPLTDAITALTRYANETTGASDTTLSDAVETLVEGYGQGGGGDHWVRPAEWANFDLLSPDDHAVYMTFDNSCPPTHIDIYAYKAFYLQRVRINSDGSVDVLESLESSARGGDIAVDIQADAGDYPCYRVKAVSAELTEFALGGSFRWQKLLERWFNLPYCVNFNVGYSYRNFFNCNVVAETFVGFPQGNKPVSFEYEYSLVSLRNISNIPLRYSSRAHNFSFSFIEGEFIYSSTTLGSGFINNRIVKSLCLSLDAVNITSLKSAFEQCRSAESITLPNADYSALTTMESMCRYCNSLKSFEFPDGDYSAVTTIANMFQECYALAEPIILPKTLTCVVGNSVFADCLHLPCIVILSETMLTLSSVNAFTNLYTNGRHFRVYVRQALIAEYQQATNWAIIYATDEDFFQPIEGSEFEYLLEGE